MPEDLLTRSPRGLKGLVFWVAVRYGLVGCGEIGRVRANAVAAAGTTLVAAADSDVARARRIRPVAFEDAAELLAGPEIDCVIVSTPPDSHESIVIAALEAGKHVLCEKPAAPTPRAARRMAEAAARAGKALAIGFNQRHFPNVAFLKALIDDGKLGRISRVAAYAGHPGPPEHHSPWESDPGATGGGALMDNGIHLIDHVRYLGGEFDEVSGVRSSEVWDKGAEDNASVLLAANDGRSADLRVSWTEWRGYRFWIEVYGDLGVGRASYGPMYAQATYAATPGGTSRTERRFFPSIALREKLVGWQTTVQRTFEAEIRDLESRVAGSACSSASAFDGFRAVEIAHALYEASDARRPVRLSDPF